MLPQKKILKIEIIVTNTINKPHSVIGSVSRQLCWLFDGWIVGGAVDFISGKSSLYPKDIDIVIPIQNWINASKLIPTGSLSNSFGGFKFKDDNETSVDVWTDDICMILLMRDVNAYQPKYNITIGRK